MQYYLEHYFNPDFNHQDLRPTVDSFGNADRYNMGYAQNVSNGQILAEVKPLEECRDVDGRFVLDRAELPVGPNTCVNPDYPRYLLAAVNGYVFYHNGLISVKKHLQVHGNVDFRTGNIIFVNDLSIEGDVKAGFYVHGSNVHLQGMVEGGVVRSRKDMVINGGARGGPSEHCLISAGGSLSMGFCEKAEVRARGRLTLRRFSAHSDIFSLGPVVVHERLLGGVCHGQSMVYVKELGTMGGAETRVHVGYNPFAHRRLERVEFEIGDLETRANHYASVTRNAATSNEDLVKKLDQVTRKLRVMQRVRKELRDLLERDERYFRHCRVVVTGTVHGGAIVSIGDATRYVEEAVGNICFFYQDGEVRCRPNPKSGVQA